MMEREEGEMSDDNAMLIDELKEPVNETGFNCTVLYKAEKNGIFIEKLEKVDATKLEERAKRFGLNLTGNRVVTQKQIDELYTNFGIESGNERHFRFDSLHLSGVNGLTTREIFEYLEDYKPVSLEWIDNISCNVVCQDHISAALALLVHSREIHEDLKKMLNEKSAHHWREGMPHPKQDFILMRFATNGDKKMNKKNSASIPPNVYFDESMDSVSKNPWGDLCKSWGVYDHQEVFNRKLPKHDYEDEIEEPSEVVQIKNKKLAMRLGKRSHHTDEIEDSASDSEWKKRSKIPRMRMHADDEESKQKKKQILENCNIKDKESFAPLSIEVINSQSTYSPRKTTRLSDKFKNNFKSNSKGQRDRGIQSRLGVKVLPTEEAWSSDESSDNSDHNVLSRVQKVSSKTKNISSVWSRLETKISDSNGQNDLRQILKTRRQKRPDDLREKIGKSKQSNLRIEIDNNYVSD